MTLHTSGEQIDTVLALLRAEEPLEHDPAQLALLRHECGVIEEQRGDAEAATREYLAAYDTDAEMREALEAAVRLHSRTPKEGDLGRLLQTLADSAADSAESARAYWELAVYRHSVEKDLAGARAALESALEADPAHAASWLELELVAASEGDQEAIQRALEARAALTSDPTWQGLLLIELAEMLAEAGNVERASNLLDTAAAVEGRGRFRSRIALERIAIAAGDRELQAHALEGQAELIAQALDDPETAERVGIPRPLCQQSCAADAWLHAGELRRQSGDVHGAVAALDAAAERFDKDALIARLRMTAADAAGDAAAAVRIAQEQLNAGVDGPAGSSLWLRVGRAAELNGDVVAALEAYSKALDLDGNNVSALTLRIDNLALSEEPTVLAEAIEKSSERAGSPAARARVWVVAAYVWATRARAVDRAKAALAKAEECGLDPVRCQRHARMFAALSGADAWYAEATAALLALSEDPQAQAALRFEQGRSLLLAGDNAAAVEVFNQLGGEGDEAINSSAWLGRALAAYAVGIGTAAKRDGALLRRVAAAESDAELRRGLAVMAGLLGSRSGDAEAAIDLLAVEHDKEPGDVAVGLFLADLRRTHKDHAGAASVLATLAANAGDASLGGALQLEAGFVLWLSGAKEAAIEQFEQALDHAPQAASLVLGWALRGAGPDDLRARRRAAEITEETEGNQPAAALERLGLGLADRDGDGDVRSALEELDDLNPGGDIALAAALGRLLCAPDDEDAAAAALEQLETLGGAATSVARAERFRVARFVERDAERALDGARAWSASEPGLHSSLEWLAAAYAADDRASEVLARQQIAAGLEGEAATGVTASAALIAALDTSEAQPFIRSEETVARLTNMELVRPGGDPARRAAALRLLGDSVGDDGAVQASRLAAWSDLARGAYPDAQAAFKAMVDADPGDIASWEGYRSASEKLGDHVARGVALAQLGNLCGSDERAGEMWEQAGLTLLEHTDAHDDAEIAFARALKRDKTRAVAFDKLFRRVRARNDDDRLLQLINARLKVTEDTREVTKMYWERARVLRRKGDAEGALDALQNVTMLEADHVGALALSGEISITRGDFAGAAPLLARLAGLKAAPKQQRLVSGIAAVDLFEKKLGEPKRALEVLSQLYRDGLSNAKVRERLARTAARVGNWAAATEILERLMQERQESKGRAEAARLAMRIYRDKLEKPADAGKAVRKLLEEIPDDPEAVRMLLKHDVSEDLKGVALPRAGGLMLESLAKDPFDLKRVKMVIHIASARNDLNLRRALIGVAIALGDDRDNYINEIATYDARSNDEPTQQLDELALKAVADRDDVGPIAELFQVIAPIVTEALGPNLKSEGVGRRQKVDSSSPVRGEIARWAGAMQLGDFDVYVAKQGNAVKGSADPMAFVVGGDFTTPLDAAGRSTVSRAVFALRRGSTAVLYRDGHDIACVVAAVCNDAGVAVPAPRYAMYAETERAMRKAMSRKIRKMIGGICQNVVQTQQDPLAWAAAAQRSIDRMTLIASGDASSVIDQIVGPLGSPARETMKSNRRAQSLLSFAVSDEYLHLRRKLGMGIA